MSSALIQIGVSKLRWRVGLARTRSTREGKLKQTWMSNRIKCTDSFIKPIAIPGCLLGLVWFVRVLSCLYGVCTCSQKENYINFDLVQGREVLMLRLANPTTIGKYAPSCQPQARLYCTANPSHLSNWTEMEDYSRSILGNFHTILAQVHFDFDISCQIHWSCCFDHKIKKGECLTFIVWWRLYVCAAVAEKSI